MRYITDFADEAVLLPVAIVTGLVFLGAGWIRGALGWMIGVSGALFLILVSKLLLVSCGLGLYDVALRSPSGHAGGATVVYGGMLGILVYRYTGHRRWTLVLAIPIAVMIGLSRLWLGAHTGWEVAIGGVIGVAGAWMCVMLAGPPPQTLRAPTMLAPAVILMLLLHGFRMPAEAAIRMAAAAFWGPAGCR